MKMVFIISINKNFNKKGIATILFFFSIFNYFLNFRIYVLLSTLFSKNGFQNDWAISGFSEKDLVLNYYFSVALPIF